MAAKTEYQATFASLEPDTVIVVYDSKTGAVRHVHQEVTLPGGTAPTPEQQMERAIAFARELPRRVSTQLKAMQIAPTAFRNLRGGAFAVDLKAGLLVKRKAASDTPSGGERPKKKKSPTGSRKPKQKKRGR